MLKYLSDAFASTFIYSFMKEYNMMFMNRLDPTLHPKKRYRFLVLSFLIPFFILVSAFAVQMVHPFGTRMILTVDLYHQYAPFVAELRDKILHGDSLLFSWNVGPGTNFWAIFANYASSPLNLLMLLFPQQYLSDGIAFVVCLRAGIAGFFFALLLRDIDNRREDLFMSCFGGLYGLCGWVLAYFWNIMWFDAVMLLPLVVLGLRRLMRDRKPALFCISLFFCIWSNYYAAFFVCLFLLFYAPVCYISIFQNYSLRNFWSSVWRFATYGAIAGGMAAILVYPTWLTLQNASATGDKPPADLLITQEIFDFGSRFFLTSHPNIRDGLANVYCGVAILILVPLYFLCNRIRLQEKIAYGLLLVFLYFGFALNLLNFVWHGFHFPNQIPFRQAFLMSFILLIMTYKVLRNLKSFTPNEISVSVFAVLAYIILSEKFTEGDKLYLSLILTAVFVIAYGVAFRAVLAQKSENHYLQRWILCGIIGVEMIVATQVSIGMVSMNESFTGWDFYGKKSDAVTDFIQKAEKSGEDGPFIRAEMYPSFISNMTALYHVKGMSVFTSTESEDFIVFMKELGFHNNGINGVRNYGLTEVTAALFGIRYLIDVNGDAPVPKGFTSVPDTGSLTVTRNENALSVGFMVPTDALSYAPRKSGNPFLTTNEFMNSLGIDSVYTSEVLVQGESVQAAFTSGNAQSGYFYNLTGEAGESEIHVDINAKQKGSHLYLYVQSSAAASVTVSAVLPESSEPSSSRQDTRTGQIIDIGYFDPSLNQNIKITFSKQPSGQVGVFCYSLNEEAYAQMLSELGTSQLTVTSYDSTHLRGTVSPSEDGHLLLTVPYDKGWTAKVDGQSVIIEKFGNALMAIPLSAGEHTVSLVFVPEGMKEGAVVSAVSLGVLCLLLAGPHIIVLRRRLQKGREILTEQNMPATESIEDASTSGDTIE
jgi:uncharacterized membrane protein YfhO